MTTYRFETLTRPAEHLHGVSAGDADKLAIHVHGTWGNFYENPFALGIAPSYLSAGYRYASINTPGHDGGSIDEDFDESIQAVGDWVDALKRPGDSRLILQGHSLGALKLMRLASTGKAASLSTSGLVLFSPFDLVAFYAGVGDAIERKRSAAGAQAELRGESVILDTAIFDLWPIGVGTFLRATEVGGPWDIFPTRDGSVGELGSIGIPTLVVLGSADFAATGDVADLLSDHAPSVDVQVIDGAPHNFAGYENELYSVVESFLQRLQPSLPVGA